ncbi:hypothetical protein QPK87_13015 [Kamptonema cortianum]|uniref:Uncharacterized protein n=1 Tax=Geitlerinema calcuttense NRMC-F 0142 TaxID=2922238 RepID=A0ABT7LY21_9CYAN|nr:MULTISPECIES: hypothetical protein [Cyanophyceae]MDK3157489.1 hypothetical protein [Kamptonema cortianum]MDL5052603.1 hypothetical protein [Oscillatoria laete-virens NRMC-F 0139]MDL5056906.1 hypothetical protein [Geitlerinema calcuttense NRMC-F 0142]
MNLWKHMFALMGLCFFASGQFLAAQSLYEIEATIFKGHPDTMKDLLPQAGQTEQRVRSIPQSRYFRLLRDKKIQHKTLKIRVIPGEVGRAEDFQEVIVTRNDQKTSMREGVSMTAKIETVPQGRSAMLDFQISDIEIHQPSSHDEEIRGADDSRNPPFSEHKTQSKVFLRMDEYSVVSGSFQKHHDQDVGFAVVITISEAKDKKTSQR